MKQSNKKQSDQRNKELLPLEYFLNFKAREMIYVAACLILCEEALAKEDKTWKVYNHFFIYDYFLKDKSKTKVMEDLIDKHTEILDGNTERGRSRLEALKELAFKLFTQYIADKKKKMNPLLDACYLMPLYNYKNLNEMEIIELLNLQELIRNTAFEAIGYWTAKLEEKKRNYEGGAKAMKKQGKRKEEEIRKVIDELNIKSLLVFNKDKALKEIFIKKAKEATKAVDEKHKLPLDKKTIYDKARVILKERKTTV